MNTESSCVVASAVPAPAREARAMSKEELEGEGARDTQVRERIPSSSSGLLPPPSPPELQLLLLQLFPPPMQLLLLSLSERFTGSLVLLFSYRYNSSHWQTSPSDYCPALWPAFSLAPALTSVRES